MFPFIKKKKKKWMELQQTAFNEMKQALGNAPILRVPDFWRPFIVRSDASNEGLGAMLLEEFEDGLFPIAYASRKLKKNERNYCTIEKEYLAAVYAVKRFQLYLYGTDFVIQTDRKLLAYIQRCKIESSREMRWAIALQSYKFRVESIPGKHNIGADYLSRLTYDL